MTGTGLENINLIKTHVHNKGFVFKLLDRN